MTSDPTSRYRVYTRINFLWKAIYQGPSIKLAVEILVSASKKDPESYMVDTTSRPRGYYTIIDAPRIKRGKVLRWSQDQFDEQYEFYTVKADGSLSFIPHYVAHLSGDDSRRNEWFKTICFTAPSVADARKKAVSIMREVQRKNPSYDVYDVTVYRHTKQDEFKGVGKELFTIHSGE